MFLNLRTQIVIISYIFAKFILTNFSLPSTNLPYGLIAANTDLIRKAIDKLSNNNFDK